MTEKNKESGLEALKKASRELINEIGNLFYLKILRDYFKRRKKVE